MRVLLLLVIFISLSCGVAQAAEHSMAVTVPVFTRHFPSSSPDLNEHNHGLGLEYTVRKDVAVTAGLFNNSFRKRYLLCRRCIHAISSIRATYGRCRRF